VLSTGASVASRAVVGDTGGAIAAGVLGSATAGLGATGAVLGVGRTAATAVAGAYSGGELAFSLLD
jgi:hypothetical protein